MNYIKVSEAAAKWNISARRARILRAFTRLLMGMAEQVVC